jgi:uncharacterized protein (UPF0212 family)
MDELKIENFFSGVEWEKISERKDEINVEVSYIDDKYNFDELNDVKIEINDEKMKKDGEVIYKDWVFIK